MVVYKKLLAGIKSLYKIYDMPYQELLDAMEQSEEEVLKYDDAFICHLSYNIFHIVGSVSSRNGQLTLKNMTVPVEGLSVVMYLGVHKLMYSSALPFKSSVRPVKRKNRRHHGPC